MPQQPTISNHSHEILYFNSVLDNNFEEFSTYIGTLNLTNYTAFVDAFNAAIGNLYIVVDYMCVNGCAACINGTCGILETSESQNVFYNVGNYTYEEIIFGSVEFSGSANGNFTLLNCIDYTTNEEGNVCFGAEYYGFDTETPEDACYFEYNGIPCNSCDILLNDCYTADCTNIESTAMIDTCNGTGFVGPFTFLQYFFDNIVTNSTFTVGSCDIASSPTSPTGTPNAITFQPVVSGAPSPFFPSTTLTTQSPSGAPSHGPALPSPNTIPPPFPVTLASTMAPVYVAVPVMSPTTNTMIPQNQSPSQPTNTTPTAVNSAIGVERPTSNIDSGALSLAAIIGIVAGGTAGLFLMACGGYALGRHRRKDTATVSNDQKGTTNFQEDAGIIDNDISEPHMGNMIDRNNNDSETIQIPSGLVVALPAQAHIDDTNTSNNKGSETIQITSRLVVQVLPKSRIHDTNPDYEVSQKDQCRSVGGEQVRIVNAVAVPNRNKSEKM
jgi:hypothetical protein